MGKGTTQGGGRRSVLALPSNIGDIKDPELQRVLMPLYHAWNVRNGYAGNGEEKFLTKADIEDLIQKDPKVRDALTSLAATSVQDAVSNVQETVGDQIKEISATIFNDPLWINLGENIERLDTSIQGVEVRVANEESARVEGDNAIYEKYDLIIFGSTDNDGTGPVGGILQELTGLANDYAALAQITNKVQATLGEYLPADGQDISEIVTVEEQMRAFGDMDDHLAGEYTVKIDHSGYVSGFGLASYPAAPGDPCSGVPDDDGPEPSPVCSRFYIRADVFAVGHPDQNAYPVAPFIVKNGKVYIDTAMIQDATIDTAKIGFLYSDKIVGGVSDAKPITINEPGWTVPNNNNMTKVYSKDFEPLVTLADLPPGVPAQAALYRPTATITVEIANKHGGDHEDAAYLQIGLENLDSGGESRSPVIAGFTKEVGSCTVTHALSYRTTQRFRLNVYVSALHKVGYVSALTGLMMTLR